MGKLFAELVQFPLQGATADAEQVGGAGAVAAGVPEGSFDALEFEGLQVETFGGGFFAGSRAGIRAGSRAGIRGGEEAGEVLRGDLRGVGHDHAVLDGGAQLADVARPRVGAEEGEGGGGERLGFPPVLGGELAQEGAGEEDDVLSPLCGAGASLPSRR